MITQSNRIIIVDDQESELTQLSKVFFEYGYGCRSFIYDPLYDNPLSEVRIAFFDIKINPSGGSSDEQTFATLANALKSYISNTNPPFALIFWTSNEPLITEFKKFIQDRDINIPKPYLINSIDKHRFLDRSNELEVKIKEIFNEEPLKLLFEFEQKSAQAASNTLKKVFEIIPKDDKWGENNIFNNNFKKIFAKIAAHTLGEEHAKADTDKAIIESLLPILSYHFLELKDSTWKKYLYEEFKNSIAYPAGFNERELNTIFHVEKNKLFPADKRGGVYKYILSAPCWISNVLNPKYFEEIEKESNELFNLFIPFNKDLTDNSERENIKSNSQLILIECSAACDYSQNKKREKKFLLGLITPVIDNNKIMRQSEAIYKLPEFYLDGKNIQIWVNFNFLYSIDAQDKRLKNPIFIIKNELMTLIGSKYANHVSRIGITSF